MSKERVIEQNILDEVSDELVRQRQLYEIHKLMIYKLIEKYPNDVDLGREVRKAFNPYR